MRLRAGVAVAVALLASGCGVRGAAPAASSPAAATLGSLTGSANLSVAGYRTAAIRACRAYRRQVAALPAPRTTTQFARYVARLQVLTVRRIAALRALPRPAALAAGIHRLDRYVTPVTGAVARLSTQLRRGQDPRRAVNAFRGVIARLSPPINAAWEAVGVPACVT